MQDLHRWNPALSHLFLECLWYDDTVINLIFQKYPWQQEKLTDIEDITKSRKLKDRQYNGQEKEDKQWSTILPNTTHKKKNSNMISRKAGACWSAVEG